MIFRLEGGREKTVEVQVAKLNCFISNHWHFSIVSFFVYKLHPIIIHYFRIDVILYRAMVVWAKSSSADSVTILTGIAVRWALSEKSVFSISEENLWFSTLSVSSKSEFFGCKNRCNRQMCMPMFLVCGSWKIQNSVFLIFPYINYRYISTHGKIFNKTESDAFV